MKQTRTRHIPIFVPHMGCPHRCVFCDQRAISGQSHFAPEAVRREIDTALATIDRQRCHRLEIAYFGGSFTAIEPTRMHALLALAADYVAQGRVDGIRFSTRPDAVGEALLDALAPYPVTAIELGLQSMDDRVLLRCQRGHTAEQARDACRRIVARGYTLAGQMMTGLPGATQESDRQTAQSICALGATEARIYPTVVLRGTPLEQMMRSGEYTPPTQEQAIESGACALDCFERAGVTLLRIGLCEHDGLRDGAIVGGAHHAAMGELIRGELWYQRLTALLEPQLPWLQGASVHIAAPSGCLSQVIGQRRRNITRLRDRYQTDNIHIREDGLLPSGQLLLERVVPRGRHSDP